MKKPNEIFADNVSATRKQIKIKSFKESNGQFYMFTKVNNKWCMVGFDNGEATLIEKLKICWVLIKPKFLSNYTEHWF